MNGMIASKQKINNTYALVVCWKLANNTTLIRLCVPVVQKSQPRFHKDFSHFIMHIKVNELSDVDSI